MCNLAASFNTNLFQVRSLLFGGSHSQSWLVSQLSRMANTARLQLNVLHQKITWFDHLKCVIDKYVYLRSVRKQFNAFRTFLSNIKHFSQGHSHKISLVCYWHLSVITGGAFNELSTNVFSIFIKIVEPFRLISAFNYFRKCQK